jgi:small-conductance mechanosensitive channel
LNFVEKIIIQLIAISFHLRTYADRIEINKFETQSLVKLYIYSKEKIAMEDSEFELPETAPSSGIRTPMKYISKAGKGARQALYKVGDVAGKVAGDFTGRAVATSTHPQQVILQLLSSTSGAQVLARRLYRTYCPEGAETVNPDDLRVAFESNEEADAAFSMFDKDMNGDISMEELEAVCVEIGRERKAITASLKDLDSVVSKLDHLFLFIVAIITILVFISLISTSAAGVLTSAGSAVLALSWLFSATAQEVLQSIVFVFIKHPFDVGDRVTIYGNTGKEGLGDDYFVKEISLLFTEFKKMEGHVVQAPNSYLNTLFILNQRRSGGLAEAVPVTMKFGTTLEQLDGLRQKLLDFVGSERREYQHNILTELKTVFEAYSISMNVVFFYKSNWQNELLRLQRRNKFICALMVSMQELGIEGPRRTWAGQNSDAPMYMQYYQPPTVDQPPPGPLSPLGGPRDSISNPIGGRRAPSPGNLARQDSAQTTDTSQIAPRHSILRHSTLDRTQQAGRGRGESLTQMSKRVDFSLGMSTASQGDIGDVFDKPKPRIPVIRETSPSPERKNKDLDGHSLGRSTSRDTNETGDSRSRSRWGSKRILGSLAHPGRRSIEHNDLESRIEGSGAIPAAVPAGPGPIERGIPMQELPPTHPPLHSAAGHRGTVDHLPGIPEAASRPGSVAMSQPPAVTVADRRATVEEEVDNDTKASGKTL